ncbi:putative serine-rich protein [Solea senegalensis]|uniref:Serine-rich protein n=2 Tax=Solea senegalensis TaxID=28829 RepID=A0AAV6SK44_SOLSE|nr:putative serine-rich protein [Solea senegalensis]
MTGSSLQCKLNNTFLFRYQTLFFWQLEQEHQQYHNMNGVLLLLYCVSALLYGADGRDQDETSFLPNNSTAVNPTSRPASPANFTKVPENSSMMTSETSTPVLSASSSHSTTTAPVSTHRTTTTTIPPTKESAKKGCGVVYLVSGVLILVCTVLLLSTLLLLWKVCQLRQRLKSLSSNGDLISNSEYWMGTARKNKSKPEVEAKQTAVLMSDFSETQEDAGNDNNEDEDGKGEAKENKDGQVGEEKT